MRPLLLLHGALGAAGQLTPLKQALAGMYEVHTFSFSGHGGRALPQGGLSISLFADELLAYMDAHGLQQAAVFGYSMGGYVALYLAKNHPGRISRIITLATKFQWDPPTASREVALLNPEKITAKLPHFARDLAQRHAPVPWQELLYATAQMLRHMGADSPLKLEDYARITLPVLLLLGDRDQMVNLEETLAVFKALPQAAMGMLPHTPHPLEQSDPELLALLIHRFLQG